MHRSSKPKRSTAGKSPSAMRESKTDNSSITLENAENRMGPFIKYYKGIGLVAENEWEDFLKAILGNPSVVFRFCRLPELQKDGQDKQSHAEILNEYMKKTIIPKLSKTEINGKQVECKPLTWYPGELAYQINFSSNDIRNYSAFRDMSEFLISETAGFNVLRQEVSTMMPTLLLDVQPHHKVLDMCTAPGWKAAQLSECLTVDGRKDGFLVANDIESNRMQWRWIHGPNCMFMKNDARYLPDLFVNKESTEENKLTFDRILCDVPCSQDGTFRKNINIRGAWQITGGMNNHKTQKRLLQRGLELLSVGGKLLYCTNSMNPVENEAVVLSMLMLAPKSLELVDVRDNIPEFKSQGGLTTWKMVGQLFHPSPSVRQALLKFCGLKGEALLTNGRVMGSTGVFYETMEEASEFFKNQYEDTLFPPAPEIVKEFNMDRCIRVLPHHNNTGGFFCAVIQKTGSLPWYIPKVSVDSSKSVDKGKTDGAGDGKSAEAEPPEKKTRYTSAKPLRIVTNVSVSMLEWETVTKDETGSETVTLEKQTFDVPPIKVAPERRYGPYPKGDKNKKEDEDYFTFMDTESDSWQKVKEFYKISDDFDQTMLHLRVNQTVWYITTPFLKNLMISNKERRNVKLLKNFGLKCFAQYKHKLTPECDMVLSYQGITEMYPYIGARIIFTTRRDMQLLLAHKSVTLEKLSQESQDQLKETTPGCVIFHFKPTESEPEPNTDILLVGWRDETWVSDHIGAVKHDAAHYVRLFGMELHDLKKELKEEDENTTSVQVEIVEGEAEEGKEEEEQEMQEEEHEEGEEGEDGEEEKELLDEDDVQLLSEVKHGDEEEGEMEAEEEGEEEGEEQLLEDD